MAKVIGGKNFSVRITGFNVVLKNLELTKHQEKAIKDFLEIEAEDVIDLAQEMVPYQTGALHDTHRIGGKKTTKEIASVEIRAGGMHKRGKFVNYAQKVHAREPWLQTAVDMRTIGFHRRLAKVIKISRGR